MFRVKSSFKTQLEIKAPVGTIKNFFSDLTNFTELLAGVEGIRREPGGVARWTIATDTPVGRVRLSLPVRETSPRADMIEWSPAINENQNLLRYQIKFEEQNGGHPLLLLLPSGTDRSVNITPTPPREGRVSTRPSPPTL